MLPYVRCDSLPASNTRQLSASTTSNVADNSTTRCKDAAPETSNAAKSRQNAAPIIHPSPPPGIL